MCFGESRRTVNKSMVDCLRCICPTRLVVDDISIHYASLYSMKIINWNAEKNQLLISEWGVSFEDILFALQSGAVLDDVYHPNNGKYAHQRVFVVNVLVPYVETSTDIFLKTIIPSRKATKKYLRGGE